MPQPAAQNVRIAARLRREYELLKELDFPGIRRAFDFTDIDGRITMVLEQPAVPSTKWPCA